MSGSYIIPQKHDITKEDRNKLTGNRSFAIWFTGFSGSGKSSLANHLEKKLFEKNILSYILDGDNVRSGLNKNLGFSKDDREENIRRIGEVTKLLVDAGIVVLTAFISPFRKDRDIVRKLLKENEFFEVYVKCPVEICEKRDVKGLYSKAREGKIKEFTGIDSSYEEPLNPEMTVETDKYSIYECVDEIYKFVETKLSL